MSVEQRLKALRDFEQSNLIRLAMAALGFVDMTLAEMDGLEGTKSTSAPAEFMLLHEAAEAYREARRARVKLEDES